MKTEINPNWPPIIRALAAAKNEGKENGNIECPICKGVINYSTASNGHTRGRCQTDNCLKWME